MAIAGQLRTDSCKLTAYLTDDEPKNPVSGKKLVTRIKKEMDRPRLTKSARIGEGMEAMRLANKLCRRAP